MMLKLPLALIALLFDTLVLAQESREVRWGQDTKREAGRCSMYDTCGKKGMFGQDLPCADNGLARQVSTLVLYAPT